MFESIQGQDSAVEAMRKALARPVNSYVFFGSRGTNIEESAREFASHLIDSTGASIDRVLQQIHPDVIEYEPAGVSYRVKEDVREGMLNEIRKSPIEAKSKVIIVHDAHLLRADSANSMLKAIEEPPNNSYWILIAPSIDSLLQTIRSRCYAIHFSRLSPAIIERQLIAEGIESKRANSIAQASSGRLDRARKLATYFQPLVECINEVVVSLGPQASSVAKGAQQIVETFDEISSDFTATHKSEIDTLKKTLKNSGYADKIASSILNMAKSKYEIQEKKLRREMVTEFLDLLTISLVKDNTKYIKDNQFIFYVDETINEYRRRLVFNPSEQLFLESLLASITSFKRNVNS